MAKAHTSLV